MDQIHVKKRDTGIKAKRLRQLGMVPGNIIGKSLPESISIQMEEAEARRDVYKTQSLSIGESMVMIG